MSAEDGLPNVESLDFIEALQADYLRDARSVPESWRRHFDSLEREERPSRGWRPGPSFAPIGLFGAPREDAARPPSSERPALALLQDRVDQLVMAYRRHGHKSAAIDPLGRARTPPPELDAAFFKLDGSSMDLPVSSDTIAGVNVRTVREIVEHLRNTYCRSIGVEYMHIDDPDVRDWLRDRMEVCENRTELSRDEQVRIFTRLSDALVFEEFIQKKYVGAKRFSLEGAESLIPLLDCAIERAGEQEIDDIVLGMAHRGRLNVLVNILGKSAQEIFQEFEDADPEAYLGGGDVKYHLGYNGDWKTASGHEVHLSLCFNPSHLEFVNPVAQGRMRARQDRAEDRDRSHGMVLLIHGDAAFAGEGIVQEALNLSRLEAYTTGGTLHVIVNNQIGFTTTPEEGRSSANATAIAKMLDIPIFHVNGEDPEAVAQVVRLSMDFRREYKRDVVIDMYCYRLHGHDENDEPSLTQPLLYRAVEERGSVRDHYLECLLEMKGFSREDAERIESERRRELDAALKEVRQDGRVPREKPTGVWSGYHGGDAKHAEEVDTGVERERLAEILEQCTRIPVDFHPHRKLHRLLEARRDMASGERSLDWAAGELLAFGSLALEGHRVRLSGQDSARGTFNQRHATLHDIEDGHTYRPLEHLAPDQAATEIHNSPLSEAGVLAFEYGYSLDGPEGLVAWEAQFGDFANAAQVIIDQFLTSAEDKWRHLSGLVLLLPHGFEGQGPEHSSARLERFLVLAAEHNIQIVYPTTPAQYFHCLRRQVLRRWRKPLVVLTPKSLLRHKRAVSTLEECEKGMFRRVLPDPLAPERKGVAEILLCSGKIFYALEKEREERECADRAILRLEELYPFPAEELHEALADYPDETRLAWVQEEPENMGAWRYVQSLLREERPERSLRGVYRPESASPATGAASSHRLEEKTLMEQVFESGVDKRRTKTAQREASSRP